MVSIGDLEHHISMAMSFTDATLTAADLTGHSIVVHAARGGAARVACADIIVGVAPPPPARPPPPVGPPPPAPAPADAPRELACGGLVGMDYGGNAMGTDKAPCGYAPVLTAYADSADWQMPAWLTADVIVDAEMNSPLECQARCLASADCDFFSYEFERDASGVLFHECYLKTGYTEPRCQAEPYTPWSSQDPDWYGQSGPGIACSSATALAPACGGQIGMDYGGAGVVGTDGADCGYAPVIATYVDSADWVQPPWESGPHSVDPSMTSPFECQLRCLTSVDCDFFSYQYELSNGAQVHECYLKTGYTEARCQANPYIPWASENPQWHGQSGAGIACASATELEPACGGQIGMDYGGAGVIGSDGAPCDYAPVIFTYVDSADWVQPPWDAGVLVVDAEMTSPLECQRRCLTSVDCEFFSYQYELSAESMNHECYREYTAAIHIYQTKRTFLTADCMVVFTVKTGYTEPRCQANPYVSWGSENPAWHGQSGLGIACSSATELEAACGGQIGMDYGGAGVVGTDGADCGYAPVIATYVDSADWVQPPWESGPHSVDPSMTSPFECQLRCFTSVDCDFFSYQYELSADSMNHECYLKTGYTEARCQANPYVSWGSENPQWHGQSGTGIACSSATELEPACDGQIGMDYGGNPMGTDGLGCGYAPTITFIADNDAFSPPGWYTGPLVIDAGMTSPLQCQHRCYENPDCDFFSYEFELNSA